MSKEPLLYVARKPIKCPVCGGKPVASILWGMPIFSDELQAMIDAGKVVLGGCCPGPADWQCTHCGQEFARRQDGKS